MENSHVLTLVRCRMSDYGTFGRLFLDDVPMCYTLEPSPSAAHPCIPLGRYKVALNILSPKYRFRTPYSTLCHGCVPRLLSVPGRDGILIHIGNFAKDTLGCILVGEKQTVHRLYNSTKAFTYLYNYIKGYENLYIDIQSISP